MKVVHVHRIGGIGGSERHLLTLLPALAERGVDVSFLGLDDTSRAPDPFYDALTVPYERLPAPRDLDVRLALAVRRAIRAGRISCTRISCTRTSTARSGRTTARLDEAQRRPVPRRGVPFRRARARAARPRIIAITSALARFQIERVGLPAEKVEVVHYGLDELPAPWGANRRTRCEADAQVLLASRGSSRRRASTSRSARCRASARVIPTRCSSCSARGRERAELSALAPELGVPVLPARPRAATSRPGCGVPTLLVHPARWEGFGLALLEAMLAGKPVVATHVSSIPEIVVDGETGLLVAARRRRHALATAVRAGRAQTGSLDDAPAGATATRGRSGLRSSAERVLSVARG